jgi:hypothetical protein
MSLLVVGLAAAVPAPAGEPVTASQADVIINVRPEAVAKLMAAAVPYDLVLDVGLFEETVRLADPRNMKFFAGGVRLQLTATGSPIGFEATVEPVIRLDRDAESGAYRVRIESLPVRIGLAGTYDLAALIPVIPIETLTEYLLETKEKAIPMELQVQEIRVHPQGIEVKLETRFP